VTAKIELTEIKLHCRIDPDYTEEDALLQVYIDAALEVCQRHIGKRFDAELEFTAAIKVGCLMYAAFLYENREMVADFEKTDVPLTIAALWGVYRDPGVY